MTGVIEIELDLNNLISTGFFSHSIISIILIPQRVLLQCFLFSPNTGKPGENSKTSRDAWDFFMTFRRSNVRKHGYWN